MNYKLTIALAVTISLYGCSQESNQATTVQAEAVKPAPVAVEAPVEIELVSGIDTSGFDKSVRPQDDFFDYVHCSISS